MGTALQAVGWFAVALTAWTVITLPTAVLVGRWLRRRQPPPDAD